MLCYNLSSCKEHDMAGYKAKFLLREQCCSGTAAQEGGGVFTPGSIQNHADVALGDVVRGHGGVGWG